VRATAQPLRVLLPDPAAEKNGNRPWVPVVQKETALPGRRAVPLATGLTEGPRVCLGGV